jgi:hypothetical protein
MSHPKETVEFMDGESALLKEHDITKQGHSEITAIGKALGLT